MKLRMTIIVSLFLSLVFANVVLAQQSYNYEEMTQEQYNALLADWQKRLDAAKKGIAEEEAKIEQLKKVSTISGNRVNMLKFVKSDFL